MKRWIKRPEGSTWGDFGENDEIGRLNLLTEAKVLEGIKEVQAGKTFCLSLPLDLPGGNGMNSRRHPPVLSPTLNGDVAYMNFPMSNVQQAAIDVLCDDQVTLCLQYSTQWDGLSHVGAMFDSQGNGQLKRVYYNGYKADVDILGGQPSAEKHSCCEAGGSFARRLGIDKYAQKCMQGRGVLVDFTRHFGYGRTLIDYTKLQSVLDADHIIVEQGDMLVLRTGFSEKIVEMAGHPDHDVLSQTGAVLDGSDKALLDWVTESGIATICADNYAVEAYPARLSGPGRSILPLHHHCLFKLGVPLAELWYLKDLAVWLHEHNRSRFLLTAPPLRLPGAVGSPTTPVATV